VCEYYLICFRLISLFDSPNDARAVPAGREHLSLVLGHCQTDYLPLVLPHRDQQLWRRWTRVPPEPRSHAAVGAASHKTTVTAKGGVHGRYALKRNTANLRKTNKVVWQKRENLVVCACVTKELLPRLWCVGPDGSVVEADDNSTALGGEGEGEARRVGS
jgi:hypothetical protein